MTLSEDVPTAGEPCSPSISIVICGYNHERFVEQALDSVSSQTCQPTQLVITDDHSSDETPSRIKKWATSHWPDAELVLNSRNVGFPAMLNSVVPLLTGDLVAIMSADDWMVHDRIERQLRAFEESPPTVGMVYGDMTEVDEDGTPTGQRWFDTDRMGPVPGSGDLFIPMLTRACMSAPTVMMKRQLLVAAGPYDESLAAEDYDMFLRLSRLAEWRYLPGPMINYRVLSSSLSRSSVFTDTYRDGRLRLLRKHTDTSAEADAIISARVSQMAVSRYFEGRSAQLTADDLRFVLRHDRSARNALLWLAASMRVPGKSLGRLVSARDTAREHARIRRA
ncbi:MAG: glycosyltransferase [Fimbriimonadaceae bacterium]|nr:glycosyltransferase [Fimbriimonadaceae bacterium]